MSMLVPRSEIFKTYRNILSEIKTIQEIMFEDDEDFETGQDNELYTRQFDAKDIGADKVSSLYKIITVENSDLSTYTKELSERLVPMLMEIGVNGFVILSDLKMNIFGSNLKHKYKPVKSAFAELSVLLQSNYYDGAIQIGMSALPTYLNIMFWIERYDASVPEFIFFHDLEDRFNFHLCKEGNLHVSEYGQELFTPELLKKHGWSVIQGRCINKFIETSQVENRITNR